MLAVVMPAGADFPTQIGEKEWYCEVSIATSVPSGGLADAIAWANGEGNETNHYTIVLMNSFAYGGEEIKGNVTITTNSSNPNTLTLVLAEGGAQGFKIADGGHLTICGNGTNQLIIEGQSGNTKSLINVTSDGTFTMKANSTLTENNIAGDGGAVTVNGGEFVMEGGTITGNTATYGGAVMVNDGVFIMEDGAISHNLAEVGGGVEVSKDGRFEMSGGEIFENSAKQYGGGVIVYSGTFTMLGGSITKNTAGGVYIGKDVNGGAGTFYVAGSAEIIDNEGYNLNIASKYAGQMFISGAFNGRIGVTHGSQQSKAELIQFATGYNGYPITAEDALHFFADDSTNYGVQLREDGLYLVSKIIKAADPPKQTSVWIAAPSDSKFGSGILDNPNGGTVNFPEGFPFDAVTINQAGEVTQTSPSTAEDDFESQYKNNFPSANYYIIASADITANPDVQTDQKTRLEFTVPIEKILDGYTVGVYHGVIGSNMGESSGEKDATAELWATSDELYNLYSEAFKKLDDPSFDLEAAYYAIQEAVDKTRKALENADRLDDEAFINASEVAKSGEMMMSMIVEKLGYVPGEPLSAQSPGYTWQAEKVVETGKSDGLVHYAVEVNGLSPFVIVVEQGGAEPAKEYSSDYAPPLDHEPISATPAESPAPILGILAALCFAGLVKRRG